MAHRMSVPASKTASLGSGWERSSVTVNGQVTAYRYSKGKQCFGQ
jgi:hypothetical protein